jgi:hypothetical protein
MGFSYSISTLFKEIIIFSIDEQVHQCSYYCRTLWICCGEMHFHCHLKGFALRILILYYPKKETREGLVFWSPKNSDFHGRSFESND